MADPRIREVIPGGTITVQALGFPTGQTPSLRVVLLTTGAVSIVASTAGITEDSPGNYDKQLAIPSNLAAGDYAAEWQFGGVWYRDEDIIRVLAVPTGGYVSTAQVRAILAPDGATDQSTAAQMSDAALSEAILGAQREIDSRLRDRYTVPFAAGAVPGLVVELTRDIAAYLATLTHDRQGSLEEDQVIRLRYNRARELLIQVAKGEIDLDATGTAAVSTEPTVINPYDFDLFSSDEMGPVTTYIP